MATSLVHAELEALSGANPAGYISTSVLGRLTLERIISATKLLKGKSMQAGAGQLSATLRDIVWSTPPKAVLAVPRNPTFPDREVDVLISTNFNVVVDIFITGDQTKSISEVTLSISDARAHIRAENNILIIDGSDFDFQRRIIRLPGADALLTAAGIDLLEAAHIEGHIGYGVVTQAVSTALGQRYEIALATVFPAVNFGKGIKLAILTGGEALGIIPSETVTTVSPAHCECKDGTDFSISRTEITNTAPANPGPNDEIGSVIIGGPVAEHKDPLKDFGSRPANRGGLAGLYIPLAFAKQLTVDVMPAIKISAVDNGTVGYRAEATVGFQNVRVSFDTAGGGVLVDIDLDISVSAYCDLEIFKGLRLPIGWAVIMPGSGSHASVQLGFYPSIDNSGTVRLKSTLKKSDMGRYVAVVIGIGTALKIFGVTAWIGFLIDVVLAAIISHGLPIALKNEISKYLANKEWKLIEGLQFADPAHYFYPSAPFDVKSTSLLASVEVAG